MARLFDHFSALFAFGLAIDAGVDDGESTCREAQVRALDLIDGCRAAAQAGGAARAAIESASFAATAWLDELMRRRPGWRREFVSLQSRLYNSNNAQSEFFHHLSMLSPADTEVREVFWHALVFGFKGQYYFEEDDQGELGRLKALHGRRLPLRVRDMADLVAHPGQRLVTLGADPDPFADGDLGEETLSELAGKVRTWNGTAWRRYQATAARGTTRRAGPKASMPWLLQLPVASLLVVLLASTWLVPSIARPLLGVGTVLAAAFASWLGWLALHQRRGRRRRERHVLGVLGVQQAASSPAGRSAARAVQQTWRLAQRRIAQAQQQGRLMRAAPLVLIAADGAVDLHRWLAATGARQLVDAQTSQTGTPSIGCWHHWPTLLGVELSEHSPVPLAARPGSGAGLDIDIDIPSLVRASAFAVLACDEDNDVAGIVACVSATTLMLHPDGLAQALAGTQRWLADAARSLAPTPPVHLVITSVDRLPGYAVLRAALPETVRSQPLGVRRDAPDVVDRCAAVASASTAPPSPARRSAAELAAAFDTIVLGLQSLCMGLHQDARSSGEHLALLSLIDGLKALAPGLAACHDAWLDVRRAEPPLAWASLHLCADTPNGQADFTHELFATELPRMARAAMQRFATPTPTPPLADADASATSARAGFAAPRSWP